MAWEFSHTTEAYENLRVNLHTLPLVELRELFAQWVGFEAGIAIAKISNPEFDISNVHFNPSNYNCEDLYNWIMDESNTEYHGKATDSDFNYVDLESVDSLASAIYERVMGEYGRTCDNGGFNAYIDPYHYSELSFDLVDGAELDY